MPRITGVDIPENKPIRYSLCYIYGIGPKRADEILSVTNIDPKKRAKNLTDQEIALIANTIESRFAVEGQLKRQVSQSIQRLRDIGCYRGLRHRRGLPVRGQRTRTNARTRKGPKKTVARKKGVKELH